MEPKHCSKCHAQYTSEKCPICSNLNLFKNIMNTVGSDPYGIPQHEPGAKLDADKPKVAQILRMFARALWQVSIVGTLGADKYTMGGWQHVEDGINRYEDAQMRHKLKEWMGQEYDTDLNVLHAAQDAWNSLARLELILREKENNNEISSR